MTKSVGTKCRWTLKNEVLTSNPVKLVWECDGCGAVISTDLGKMPQVCYEE